MITLELSSCGSSTTQMLWKSTKVIIILWSRTRSRTRGTKFKRRGCFDLSWYSLTLLTMSEKFAYHQERTSFIVSQLPSYMCAMKRGESNEFLMSMMGEFIARFPMDLTGVPQPGPLRLANIDHFQLRHPDQMVKAAMKAHINISIVLFFFSFYILF